MTRKEISMNKSNEIDNILELKNITKTFLGGKIIANDDVSLTFARNEVHAIVGENGSGKSTLMNIIFGLYKQDKGDIFINKKKVNMYESGASKKYKIGMVHQHFHLVDDFNVLDNVILGQEKLKKDKKEKERVNSLKKRLQEVKFEMIEISEREQDFAGKVNKLLDIERKSFREIEKEKNLINDIKNKRAKISEDKNPKKVKKLNDEISIREEVIEKERKILSLIEQVRESASTKDQKRFIELSKEEVTLTREIFINDIKLSGAFGKIKRKNAFQRLRKIQQKYNIFLDPYAKVGRLSVGQRQMVEILKVLWEEKEIIVFDEPTATLSVIEIKALLKTIKALKEEGKTIIFISHKLKEVKEIADRVSVLRKGVLMGTHINDSKLKPADIGKLMVGKTIELNYPKRKISNKPLIKVNNLSYRASNGFKALEDVSFEIYEDEIFGLAGIEGNGQEEIVKILTNLRKPYKGNIEFYQPKLKQKKSKETEYEWRVLTDKKGYKKSSISRRKMMSHIPIDRLKHGVVPNKSLLFNSKLSDYDTGFLSKNKSKKTNSKKVSEFTTNIINNMNVDGAFNNNVELRNLSGGNQQKFVVGREVFRDHEVIIAGHPTRGLDISAIDHIYKKLIENSKGKATILYSLEINELLAVCDRVAVMYHGKIIDIIDPKKTSLDKVSRLMIGEVE